MRVTFTNDFTGDTYAIDNGDEIVINDVTYAWDELPWEMGEAACQLLEESQKSFESLIRRLNPT